MGEIRYLVTLRDSIDKVEVKTLVKEKELGRFLYFYLRTTSYELVEVQEVENYIEFSDITETDVSINEQLR